MSFLKDKAMNKLRADAGKFFVACLDQIINDKIGNDPEQNQVPDEVHAAAIIIRSWWESVRPK